MRCLKNGLFFCRAMKVYQLGKESNTQITVFLLKNVKNIRTLREKIVNGELDCCALKPALIINDFHIIIAANKAAWNKKRGVLKTKSLNTELLFNLSVSKNISQALTKFGIDDKDKNVIIVIFEENGENKFERMKEHFEGEICDEFSELSDINLIKKTYKISEKELEVSQLIDSVLSRIATKDFGSY